MEKIFKTFNLFEGSSVVVYNWICKMEESAAKVSSMYQLWKRRKAGRAELAKLDDRLLEDIGLTRHNVACEINKPFWKA